MNRAGFVVSPCFPSSASSLVVAVVTVSTFKPEVHRGFHCHFKFYGNVRDHIFVVYVVVFRVFLGLMLSSFVGLVFSKSLSRHVLSFLCVYCRALSP